MYRLGSITADDKSIPAQASLYILQQDKQLRQMTITTFVRVQQLVSV